MGFDYSRKYRCYLILGDSAIPKIPWSWEEWKRISGIFGTIVTRCRAHPALKSHQEVAGSKKPLSFGRLVWNEPSFQKWTHKSPLTNNSSDTWNFYFVELAAPSLGVCERESLPPDLFFSLINEFFLHGKQVAFNPRFFFALAEDMDNFTQILLEDVVRKIAHDYNAVITATINRPWGLPSFNGSSFERVIHDLGFMGVFKLGNPHTRPVTLDTLEEQWKEFKKGGMVTL